jgi:methionyl-tRNA synthetase
MLLLRRVSRVCTLDLQRPLFFQLRLLSTLADAKKPYYVTTPIFYPNAVPHIGHLYTLVLGDIFARYQRILDPTRPVHFLAGTDEHGLKIQQAAEKAGVEPKAFCDSLSGKFRVCNLWY